MAGVFNSLILLVAVLFLGMQACKNQMSSSSEVAETPLEQEKHLKRINEEAYKYISNKKKPSPEFVTGLIRVCEEQVDKSCMALLDISNVWEEYFPIAFDYFNRTHQLKNATLWHGDFLAWIADQYPEKFKEIWKHNFSQSTELLNLIELPEVRLSNYVLNDVHVKGRFLLLEALVGTRPTSDEVFELLENHPKFSPSEKRFKMKAIQFPNWYLRARIVGWDKADKFSDTITFPPGENRIRIAQIEWAYQQKVKNPSKTPSQYVGVYDEMKKLSAEQKAEALELYSFEYVLTLDDVAKYKNLNFSEKEAYIKGNKSSSTLAQYFGMEESESVKTMILDQYMDLYTGNKKNHNRALDRAINLLLEERDFTDPELLDKASRYVEMVRKNNPVYQCLCGWAVGVQKFMSKFKK